MPHRLRRDVTGKGVRLRVAECGQGEPVILLHGLFFDCTTWNPVSTDLCRDFRVIAPDLPGFGESEKPPRHRFKYNIATFAEAIADVYGALELGRASLVGHGLGGAVALTLAASHPELVSRLVLVDSLCHQAPIDMRQRIARIPFLGGLVFKQLVGRNAFRTLLTDSLVPSRSRIPAGRIDAYYEAFNTPAARGSALEALRGTADTNSLTANTRRIQAPTLVVWGRHDDVYPAGYGRRLAREIAGAGFELMDAGHAPQEELPAELAAIVGRFLRNERNAA
jgi:pimeloyl-ACP methyl ester carboxylesterase